MNWSWRKTWPLVAVVAFLSTAYADNGTPSPCDLPLLTQEGVLKVLTECEVPQGQISNLHIQGDDFSNLKPSDFSGLDEVRSLYIVGDSQHLKPMDTRILGMLPNLSGLKLENIDLSEAPKKFLADLKHLKRVAFINCKLSEFPEFGVEQIPFLDLSHNQIRVLPKNLPIGLPLEKGGHALMEWNLNGNQLSDISNQIEALSRALSLDIRDNPIVPLTCDKQKALLEFPNNPSVKKHLGIDTKSVNTDSSCDLSAFTRLGVLKLNGGSANDFSTGFSNALRNRSELILSNFYVTNGLSSIIGQRVGQTIRLINSDLTNLDFSDPLWRNKIVDLRISDDRKDSLPSVFNGSASVVSISINMPNLHFIPEDMFKEMPNLNDLNFRDTPLSKTSKATFQGIQVFGLPTNFGVTETGGTSEEWAP